MIRKTYMAHFSFKECIMVLNNGIVHWQWLEPNRYGVIYLKLGKCWCVVHHDAEIHIPANHFFIFFAVVPINIHAILKLK